MLMNDMNTLRETNLELLRAVNMLKKTGFLYSAENPTEYQLLLREKDTVDYWLSVDNAELAVAEEYGTVYIRLFPDSDVGFQNALRGRLTLNEMRVYLALNALYEAGYVGQGVFVEVNYAELLNQLQSLGFSFDGGTSVTKTSVVQYLRSLKKYGFLIDKSGQTLITPAIRFGLDSAEFTKICGSVLSSWLEEQKETLAASETFDESDLSVGDDEQVVEGDCV